MEKHQRGTQKPLLKAIVGSWNWRNCPDGVYNPFPISLNPPTTAFCPGSDDGDGLLWEDGEKLSQILGKDLERRGTTPGNPDPKSAIK